MNSKNNQWRILIVDDEPNNLQLLRQILKNKYQLSMATNGNQAISLAKKLQPDLILLDVMMPELDGYKTCIKLKSISKTSNIPVIFVTAKADVKDEQYGFEIGAVDYITKPISPAIVLARVQTHLFLYDQQKAFEVQLKQRTKELKEIQRDAISMLGEAGHFNDADTGQHINRMTSYTKVIAQQAGWSDSRASQLKLAASMHDMGKIGIPDSILKKASKLNTNEWEIMKTHSQLGFDILSKSNTPLFQLAAEVALYHHEKWDGSGYPTGIAGEQIPEGARIAALADVFDALTTARPYKKAWPVEDAFSEIKNTSGTSFDPRLVEAFFAAEQEIRALKHDWDTKMQGD